MNGNRRSSGILERHPEENGGTMHTPKWREQGEEPDYRFTLANERTFLAWIRTALALLAGGVLLHQFSHALGPRWVVVALAVALGVIGAVLSVIAYTRWRANEIAMRRNGPLPFSVMIPGLAAVTLLVAAVIAVLMVIG
ncbi:YidH family protein [Luethyella okanaganae]|uniref:YidH family protein n=1 Tax=Luethyella okanaganae TaxID=69372 RepID=A0ABW1VCH0_9MICO